MARSYHRLSVILFFLIAIFTLLFIFGWYLPRNDGSVSYAAFIRIIQRRSLIWIAMVVSSSLVALSTLSFQTLTQNKLITPSLLGFDAWFVATQTLLVLLFSTTSSLITNPIVNFLITSVVMVSSIFLFMGPMLIKKQHNLTYLLLIGMVLSSFLRSSTNFISIVLDPDEFQTVVAITNVNFNTIPFELIILAIPVMMMLVIMMIKQSHQFDVLALGKHEAIGLGIPYDQMLKRNLLLISIAMALATALVGSLSFIGLIAVHLAYSLTHSTRHKHLFLTSALLAAVMMLLGQLLVEWTGYQLQINVIIQFIGGIYLMIILLKEQLHD